MIISKYKKSSSLEELLMHGVEATLSITVIMGHQRDMTCYHTLIISATPSALFLPWRKIHCPSSKIRKQSSCVKVKHWETITNRFCSAALVWSACFMKSWDLQQFEKQCCKADGERMVDIGWSNGLSLTDTRNSWKAIHQLVNDLKIHFWKTALERWRSSWAKTNSKHITSLQKYWTCTYSVKT